MAKYCSKECDAICDFCINYIDNNERFAGYEGFAGQGYCAAKEINVDALDYCEDDFVCFRTKEESK